MVHDKRMYKEQYVKATFTERKMLNREILFKEEEKKNSTEKCKVT